MLTIKYGLLEKDRSFGDRKSQSVNTLVNDEYDYPPKGLLFWI
jgi:hypothetical protein